MVSRVHLAYVKARSEPCYCTSNKFIEGVLKANLSSSRIMFPAVIDVSTSAISTEWVRAPRTE